MSIKRAALLTMGVVFLSALVTGCATKSDIEALQKSDKELSQRIDENRDKTGSLSQTTADIQVNLNAIKGKITSLDSQAADLDKRISDSNAENQSAQKGIRDELTMVRAQIADLKKLQADYDNLLKMVEELRARGGSGEEKVKAATDELSKKWNDLNQKYGPL